MITLGIETSCDETALALIETREESGALECRVIESLVHSQAELHSAYGGVFPTLAKREHGKNLPPLLNELLEKCQNFFTSRNNKIHTIEDKKYSSVIESFRKEMTDTNPDLFESLSHGDFLRNIPPIDRIAVTEGPGLEPALWVGINFARILSTLWSVPVIPVNHMEGHIVGSLLNSSFPYGAWQKLKPVHFPAIAFLLSGGHTELVEVCDKRFTKNPGAKLESLLEPCYMILGKTKDDAVGEAFDKVARLLELPYPGGPHVSLLSKQAEIENLPSPVKLPRPMLNSGDLNFSFSGLKTAVLYAVRDHNPMTNDFKKGLAHEFELAVTETLDKKLHQAIESTGAQTLIVGGGVSANTMLRKQFTATAEEFNIPIYLPTQHVSGDNALMIALAGSLNKSIDQIPPRAQGTKSL